MKIIRKKILAALIIAFININLVYSVSLPLNGLKQVFKADIESQRIPAGKVVKLRFLDDLNTVHSSSGDQFTVSIAEDIIINRKIILPSGTIMRGVVENITKSARPKSPAIIYLSFDHVVTPVGKQIPVTVRLANLPYLTSQGGISAGGSYKEVWEKNVKDGYAFVKKSVQVGLDTGEVAKYFVTPVTAVGGSCVSFVALLGKSVYNLFLKGNEVVIPEGRVISSVLAEPLDIPTN